MFKIYPQKIVTLNKVQRVHTKSIFLVSSFTTTIIFIKGHKVAAIFPGFVPTSTPKWFIQWIVNQVKHHKFR